MYHVQLTTVRIEREKEREKGREGGREGGRTAKKKFINDTVV